MLAFLETPSFAVPAGEAVVTLVGSPDTPIDRTYQRVRSMKVDGRVLAYVLLPFFLVGAATALLGVSEGSVGLVVFGLFFVAFPVAFYLLAKPNTLTKRVLGDVDVKFKPSVVAPGGSLVVSTFFEPEREVDVSSVRTTLRCRELVRFREALGRDGKLRGGSTTTHDVAEIELPSHGPRSCKPGERVHFESSFEIPTVAPPTLHLERHSVVWMVEVRLELDGHADHRSLEELLVLPAEVAVPTNHF